MMTDPIADMLTRIRNAVAIERPFVDIPTSHEKEGIAQVLQREGYIWDFEIVDEKPVKILRLNLKYGPNGERIIQEIKRISKPGCRVYVNTDRIPKVMGGLGVAILSTPKGVQTGKQATKDNVGGEVLCHVW